MAMRLDKGDWIHGFELIPPGDDGAGMTVETPRGRKEAITPRRHGGSRATKGRVIMKTGTFKPWTSPTLRYDKLHAQPEAQSAEGEE